MIRHVTRLIWNRRRSHALLLLELGGSFLALALVFTLGVHYAANWGRPLGFDWEPVWVVHVDMGPEGRATAAPPRSNASAVTLMRKGAVSCGGEVSCVSRPSVAAMAGCDSG